MEIKDIKKEYPNDEITIVWQPKKCIHSEKCWRGLPEVFKYQQKPWLDPQGASSDQIMNQIDKCPSGALSYYKNNQENIMTDQESSKIHLAENGPLLIKGSFKLIMADGTEKDESSAALCRCGASSNKPYCDGSHAKVGFKS